MKNKIKLTTIIFLSALFSVTSFSLERTEILEKMNKIKNQLTPPAQTETDKEKNNRLYEASEQLYEVLSKIQENKKIDLMKDKELLTLAIQLTAWNLFEHPSSYTLVNDFILTYFKSNSKLVKEIINKLPKNHSKDLNEALKNAAREAETGNG